MRSQNVSIKIPNKKENMLFAVQSAESFLRSNLTAHAGVIPDHFIEDIKILVNELVGNSVKHQKCTDVELYICLKESGVEIGTVSEGEPFKIKPLNNFNFTQDWDKLTTINPPFGNELIGHRIPVYIDGDYLVFGIIRGDYEIDFILESHNHDDIELSLIPEHYGLFLITRLAGNVKFFRNAESKNVFSLFKCYSSEDLKG